MTYKLAVTKPGYNVLTETNVNNFVFHSDYSSLQYDTSGNISVTTSSGNGQQTVAHGLGYIPFFIGFVQVTPGGSEYCSCPVIDAGFDYIYASVWANSTYLYFNIEHSGGVADHTRTFYYKIFRNEVNI